MKALRNLFLLAVTTAAVLFFYALYMVASQSSDPTSLNHASFTDWPSLAIEHIKKNHSVFLRWGVILFLVLPIIAKTILNIRHGRNSSPNANAAADDAGPRPQTAWDELNKAKAAKLPGPAPVPHRRVS